MKTIWHLFVALFIVTASPGGEGFVAASVPADSKQAAIATNHSQLASNEGIVDRASPLRPLQKEDTPSAKLAYPPDDYLAWLAPDFPICDLLEERTGTTGRGWRASYGCRSPPERSATSR